MQNDDIIIWSKDYFLNWSDFKAEVNSAAFEDSSSKIKFHHTWTVESEMVNGDIYFLISNIQLTTQFLRHLSWVRLQNSSHDLLKHEQGHFDLAESLKPIFVEQIKYKFKDSKFPTRGQNEEQRKQFAREDSGLMILQELEKCYEILEEESKKYCAETEFGNNSITQKEYEERFKKLRS